MHDERVDARGNDAVRERIERRLGVLLVDPEPALHRDRHLHRRLHGRDAVADESRLGHQAGAEAAVLHAVGRAADIEVDLVVAEILADAGGGGERSRIRAAELQRDRMLLGRIADQALAVAVNDGARRHHLGVEQRAPRHEAVEEPAMPVRPVHHGRDAEPMGGETLHFSRSFNPLDRAVYTGLRCDATSTPR